MAFRVLYQAEIGEFELEAALKQVLDEVEPPEQVIRYASLLVREVGSNRPEIDRAISEVSQHWRLERMAVTDRNILRLGVAELLYLQDVPVKVAIDEAIELAKKYGDAGSGRFVNGILDAVARKFRAGELPGAARLRAEGVAGESAEKT